MSAMPSLHDGGSDHSTVILEPDSQEIQDLTSQLYELREQAKNEQTKSTPIAVSIPFSHPSPQITQSRRPDSEVVRLLKQGQTLYDRYVLEHQDELKIGDWVSLFDNDYSTVQTFKDYDSAAQHYRGYKIRFCRQYYGPQISEERLFPSITTGFGNTSGLHPMLAYADARIIHPENPQIYKDVKFMIDTGATKCTGRREILIDHLNLEADFCGTALVVGGEADMIYVQARVSILGLDGTYLAPILVHIGYLDPPPPPEKQRPEDWLLGQNYLGLCGHIWSNHGLVKIIHPF